MKNVLEFSGSGILWVFTVLQTDVVLKYINLGLSILISLIILITKITEWYKKAKEDEKISKDEIKDLYDNTKEDLQNIVDCVDDIVDAVKEQEEKDKHD